MTTENDSGPDVNTAAGRLTVLMDHLLIGGHMAKIEEPSGELRLAIVSKKPDGSGHLSVTFEFDPFVKDLAELLDYNIETGNPRQHDG